MKAWVLHKINDILFEEVKQPQIREDEVLVSVKAAGICGQDHGEAAAEDVPLTAAGQ